MNEKKLITEGKMNWTVLSQRTKRKGRERKERKSQCWEKKEEEDTNRFEICIFSRCIHKYEKEEL